MTAREKLEEAEYFLTKMCEIRPDQKEFLFNLSAFLSAARSVPDYLLEDYNVKYSLQIPLTERYFRNVFEYQAKQTRNTVALSFIQWWKQEIDTLNLDPIWSLLTNKRNIDVHRTHTKPDLVKLRVTETITATASIRIEKYNKEGKLIEICESPKEPVKPKPKEREANVVWFFREYDKEPVVSICEKYLQMMKDFVSEAEQKFP
jgi:hypothetical protein